MEAIFSPLGYLVFALSIAKAFLAFRVTRQFIDNYDEQEKNWYLKGSSQQLVEIFAILDVLSILNLCLLAALFVIVKIITQAA